MRMILVIVVGVALVLAYTFDFRLTPKDECKKEFPYCLKVEEKVR